MSFTASQTVLHLAENAAYVRITQCYDSTPKLLKNGAVQSGGLAERVAVLYMKLLHSDATIWFRSLNADQIRNFFRKKADRVTPAEYVHVYGIDEEDRIDRKIVYTDGLQTSQPYERMEHQLLLIDL
jgi:hypothetical protein